MPVRRLWVDVPKEPGAQRKSQTPTLSLQWDLATPFSLIPSSRSPHLSYRGHTGCPLPPTVRHLFYPHTPCTPASSPGPLNLLLPAPIFKQLGLFCHLASDQHLNIVLSPNILFHPPVYFLQSNYPHLSVFCLFIHSLHCSLTLNLNVVSSTKV